MQVLKKQVKQNEKIIVQKSIEVKRLQKKETREALVDSMQMVKSSMNTSRRMLAHHKRLSGSKQDTNAFSATNLASVKPMLKMRGDQSIR